MEKEERKYRLILDQLSDVVWIKGFTGQLSYVSPSIESLLGYTADEFLSSSPEKLLTKDSNVDLSQLTAYYTDVYKTLSNTADLSSYARTLELEFVQDEGNNRIVEVRANLQKDEDGKILLTGNVLRKKP